MDKGSDLKQYKNKSVYRRFIKKACGNFKEVYHVEELWTCGC